MHAQTNNTLCTIPFTGSNCTVNIYDVDDEFALVYDIVSIIIVSMYLACAAFNARFASYWKVSSNFARVIWILSMLFCLSIYSKYD